MKLRSPISRRLRERPIRSTSTTTDDAVELDLVPASARRAGRRRGTTARRAAARPRDRSRRPPAVGRGSPSSGTSRGRAPPGGRWRRSRRRRGPRRPTGWAGARRPPVSRSSHAVSTAPARTSGRSRRSSRNDLFVVPPSHEDRGLRQRTVQPGERLVAVAPVGDDLGDHRVVLRRDDVTLGDAGVDPDTRPDGERQRLDRARGGGEGALRVLGVEARLDGVPRRSAAARPPAGRRRRRGSAA